MITPDFKKRIRVCFLYYKKVLHLPKYWHFRIVVNTKITEYANVEMDVPKKTYIINVNPKKNKKSIDLKDTILHELLHSLLSPATDRVNLLLEKIKCNEKIDWRKSKKQLDMWEEFLVRKLTKIILQVKETE